MMRRRNKLTYFVIVGILVISGVNTVALTNSEKNNISKLNNSAVETWSFTISSSYPEIINDGQYVKVNIKEANEFLTVPDYPMLPFYSTVTTFPLGTKILDVKCTLSAPKEINLPKKIYPAPKLQWMGSDINSEKINSVCQMFNIDEYNFDGCYSYKTGGGIDDGKHVTFFVNHFYPVRYLSDEGVLEFIESAKFEVIYEKSLEITTYEDDYSLVIITPSSFSSKLHSLVTHKSNYGVTSKIVTLDEIYGGEYFPVDGSDNAEKIKYFIKNAVENWDTTYVFLVGDIYKLPIRTTWLGQWDVLTDLYYADLYLPDGSFSSWDTNGNGRYGEYYQGNDDIFDLYADVYIGRAACKNSNEVSTIVNKIINYEKSVYGESWFNNIILCGGDTHPGHGSVYEGEATLDKIEDAMSEFNPKKLYTSTGTYTPFALNRELRNGAGFFAYSGHGFETGLGTHPPNSDEWVSYNYFHMFLLLNMNKLPVTFFGACLTARLDYTLGDFLKLPFITIPMSTFAWGFLKKSLGGAIATIGATRTAFSVVTQDGPKRGCGYLSLKFFESYETGITVGEMLVNAQNRYVDNILDDPLTVEEFILLGDPSLKIGGYSVEANLK